MTFPAATVVFIMFCMVNCSEYPPSFSNNTSDSTNINPQLSSASVVLLSMISTLASISGSLGNALVMIAVFKFQNLRSAPDYVISSLAFSDFIVCSVYLPLMIYWIVTGDNKHSIARQVIGVTSLTASVTNMLVVTVDRLIAIRFPLTYITIVTFKRISSVIGFVWLISLISGTLHVPQIGGVSRFVLVSYCITLMLGTWSMYAYIFLVAKRQENKVYTLNLSSQQGTSSEQQRNEKKAAKTIFTIVVVYALCWLPLLLLPIFVSPSKNPVLFQKCFFWTQTILVCNSALNPYIYCVRSQKYRKQFKKLLRMSSSV